MITLTTPIVTPVINRIQIVNPGGTDVYSDEFRCRARVLNTENTIVATIEVSVTDGTCRGLRFFQRSPVPYATVLPTGLTDLKATVEAAGSLVAKKAAIESFLTSSGVLPPGT